MKRRNVLQAGAAAAAACAAPGWAQQGWPTRPVQLIVSFPPGSGVDFAARLIGEKLTAAFGQQFVVTNRPGAAGTIATSAVVNSTDGHTLLVNSASHTLYPALYPDMKLDVRRDTVAVASVAEVELVMVAATSKGWKTLQDMLNYANAPGNTLTFGSAGIGSSTHIAFERFAHAAKIRSLHVPFKGTPESVAEVASGRVDVCYGVAASANGMINSGQLVPLALSGKHRSETLKQVPTTVEAGVPDSDFSSWIGILAPAGMPPAIIERINQEVNKNLRLPEITDKLRKAGEVAAPLTVAQFDAQLRSEYASNIILVKAAGVKAE